MPTLCSLWGLLLRSTLRAVSNIIFSRGYQALWASVRIHMHSSLDQYVTKSHLDHPIMVDLCFLLHSQSKARHIVWSVAGVQSLLWLSFSVQASSCLFILVDGAQLTACPSPCFPVAFGFSLSFPKKCVLIFYFFLATLREVNISPHSGWCLFYLV